MPPWFDGAVRAALRLKEAAYRRLRRHPSSAGRTEFENRRRDFKTVSSQKYYEYLRNLTDDFKTNPKRYWSFLKCLTKKPSVSSVLFDANGQPVTNDKARASVLNEAFAAKFTAAGTTVLPDAPVFQLDTLPQLCVSEATVRNALLSVAPGKACGVDNISARIITECAEELVVPITKICSASVREGVFPERWKRANIVPIYKKGDKRQPSNYRSVSLLPLFGKILERVVLDYLFVHVSPVLCNEQHGFIPGKSCTTNLAVFLKTAWEAISDGYQTDAIYTDYSAAFQSVNHALIIHKLKHSYHLQDIALKWFVSYLSDRRQRVIVNGKTSDWKPVTSGVPEGSLLAPLLFALFINDLPLEINSGCLMYADDVKLYRKIKTQDDCFLLQDDLTRLALWSEKWGLKLNPIKCKSFTMTLRRAPVRTHYTIHDAELEHVPEMRDLGVILDTKLTFATHVSHIVSRANRSLGLMIRSFQTASKYSKFSRPALLAAYFANVRSILEYCSVIWAGAAESHTVRVDRVQHKFLSWLLYHTSGRASSLSYQDLLHHFNLPSLAARRVQHDLIFLRNVVLTKYDSPSLLHSFSLHVPARSTRTHPLFAVPRARVNTVKSGVFCRAPREMNEFLGDAKVSADLFADSVHVFRSRVQFYVRAMNR